LRAAVLRLAVDLLRRTGFLAADFFAAAILYLPSIPTLTTPFASGVCVPAHSCLPTLRTVHLAGARN
jgi:hypothetical protein